MSAELAARLTVARSAAGDFKREAAAFRAGGPSPDYLAWAHRLDAALRGVLGVIGQDVGSVSPQVPPPRRNVASDPDAPHGRDEQGTPLAPFDLNKKTGRPNLRPAGPGRPRRDKSSEPRPMPTPGDRRTILGALDDAAVYLTLRSASWCEDCGQHPAELCDRHADDIDQAEAYQALAARLREDL